MSATQPSTPADTDRGAPLPGSTPEEQGVPSAAVLRTVQRWMEKGTEPHGVVVVRHGTVVAEGAWAPYRADGIQLVYSVSKTFLAIAVGLAEHEGLLARGERLVDVFPEAAAAAGPRAARITLEDCLRMSTGHHDDTLDAVPGLAGGGEESVALFLASEPEEEPGSWFVYHNGASRVLALAVQRRTGERLVDYLRPRLLDPLGVPDFAWTAWAGSDLGFSGAHVTVDAVARLGLLLLRDGVWEGTRLLPQGWVGTASAALADTAHHPGTPDWQVGYGYQVWRCRPDGFRADGAYGQFALVLPRHDLVVAVTGCTEATQEVLDAVWEELLPALCDGPLPPDADAHAALLATLADAALPVMASAVPPPSTPAPWVFAHAPVAEHPRLAGVQVRPDGQGWALVVDDGGPCDIVCGDGRWPDAAGAPFVATGGWVEPDVFEATVVAVQTPHSLHLRCARGEVTARWRGAPLHGPCLAWLRVPRD